MKTQKSKFFLYLALCCAVVFALGLMSGCKGSSGSAGSPGAPGTEGNPGTDGTNGSATSSSSYTAAINSVAVATGASGARFTIKLTVQDAGGSAIAGLTDVDAVTSTNLGHLQFNIAKLLPGVAAQAGGTTPNTWWNVGSEGLVANLTDNGNGHYTYITGAMPVSGATTTAKYYDSTAYTRVVLRVAPNNSQKHGSWEWDMGHLEALGGGKDAKYDLTNGSTITKDVVPTSNCLSCHSTFGSLDLNPLAFHAGEGRVEVYACVVCHYENRGTDTGLGYGEAEIGNFVHAIHTAQVSGGHDFTEVRYPQDIRNCTKCHNGGTDSDNWKNKPSVKACLSCHNPKNPEFEGMTPLTSVTTTHPGHQVVKLGLGDGLTTSDDRHCKNCHSATLIAEKHETDFATTNNPNVPAGVATFAYEISQATVTNNVVQVTFKVKQNGTDAVLNTGPTGSVLTGFSGGPSFYVVYATSQDGITNPSDWNSGHTGISLQNLCDGTKGTLTGPVSGYYTATLGGGSTNVTALNVPPGASMVTAIMAGSFTQGTTARPGLAAFKAADGYTARRIIIDPARCNSCHEQLGTEPNFHSGSYNQVICAACHTPNQSSNGWSASFRTWVHGIHGAGKRTVPYTWHAETVDENYTNLEYPGVLSNCEQCHLPGTYDFSASQYTNSVIDNMQNVLVAKATYTTIGGSGAGNDYKNSPYVVEDGVTSYGTVAYSVNITTGVVTEGDANHLVSSPITAVCTSCHDSTQAIAHMKGNGNNGQFYAKRSDANAARTAGVGETCLVCHGKGRIAAIDEVHGK